MNKNKGIIGIGLIVAIVLGIVVVGGGAYYLGKGSSKQEVNNPGVNQKQEAPVVDNNQQNSSPSIKVIYPNGGENLIPGKTYDIVWKSESSSDVSIWLSKKGASDVADLITGSSLIPSSLGKYSWTIPTNNNDINTGSQFKIFISSKDANISDGSDDYFTINSTVNTEESSIDSFNHQPGAIKSIKADGTNKWILAVDLLTNNPEWLPGVNERYLNQNTKIRNLNVTSLTKAYGCGSNSDGQIIEEATLKNITDYISGVGKDIDQVKLNIKNRIGGPIEKMTDWETLRFDINGSNITAMYDICLP